MSDEPVEFTSADVEAAVAKLKAFVWNLPATEQAALQAVFEAVATGQRPADDDIQGYDTYLWFGLPYRSLQVRVNVSGILGEGGSPGRPQVVDHRSPGNRGSWQPGGGRPAP
jgi:hypothetical protein